MAVVSFLLSYTLPVEEWINGVVAIPGIAALAGIVVKVFMDELAHIRTRELQDRAEANQLAVASHMAERAFDQQARFVEEYFKKMAEGLRRLAAEGVQENNALELANDLREIREQYAPWLTQEIDDRLFPFEHYGLRVPGAMQRTLDYTDAHGDAVPPGTKRTRFHKEVFEAFMIVMGHQEPSEEQKAVAASTIMDHLRDILGASKLTTLRERALRQALRATENSLG